MKPIIRLRWSTDDHLATDRGSDGEAQVITVRDHVRVTDRMMHTARLTVAERVAEQYANEQLTDDDLGVRLQALAPHLSPYEQQAAFEELVAAIQFRQDVHDGIVTPAEVEPDLRHPEVLAERAQRWVDDALAELVGGSR